MTTSVNANNHWKLPHKPNGDSIEPQIRISAKSRMNVFAVDSTSGNQESAARVYIANIPSERISRHECNRFRIVSGLGVRR